MNSCPDCPTCQAELQPRRVHGFHYSANHGSCTYQPLVPAGSLPSGKPTSSLDWFCVQCLKWEQFILKSAKHGTAPQDDELDVEGWKCPTPNCPGPDS